MPRMSEFHDQAVQRDFLAQAKLMLSKLLQEVNEHYKTDLKARIAESSLPDFNKPGEGNITFVVGQVQQAREFLGKPRDGWIGFFKIEMSAVKQDKADAGDPVKVNARFSLPSDWFFSPWKPLNTYTQGILEMRELPDSKLLDDLKMAIATAVVQEHLKLPPRPAPEKSAPVAGPESPLPN